MVPQNLFMLVLFSDFYRKTYMRKDKKTAVVGGNKNIQKHKVINEAAVTRNGTEIRVKKRITNKDENKNLTEYSLIEPGTCSKSNNVNTAKSPIEINGQL